MRTHKSRINNIRINGTSVRMIKYKCDCCIKTYGFSMMILVTLFVPSALIALTQ